MLTIFNYNIRTKITPTLVSLFLFFLFSVIYLILTIVNFKGKPIGNDLNLEINSSSLVNISLTVLILYLTYIPQKYLKLLSFIIIPFSIHILISYDKKYPGTLGILRNKDKNPLYKNSIVKKIAIVGTITSIIGLLVGINLRFNLF